MVAAVRRAASGRRHPAAAHAAGDAVDGSPRWPSAVPGGAASASTGGFRHKTCGVWIGAKAIASTSTSVRTSVDLQEHVADAQGRALVAGDDDLDFRHAGHCLGMTTDAATGLSGAVRRSN